MNMPSSEREPINCVVNGEPKTLRAFPMERLLDVLEDYERETETEDDAGGEVKG